MVISDTNRRFSEAWQQCLPSITPQEITGVYDPVRLVLDRKRKSIGVELVPILELVHLSSARRVLEIGTSSGGTTWHMAANMNPDGVV